MLIKKEIQMKFRSFSLLAVILLSACSTPEDNARTVIADYCEAFKKIDTETLSELSTDSKLVNFPYLTESARKKASCGEQIKKISDEKFLFMLGEEEMTMPIVVEKVDGEFKITGLNL